MYHYLIQLAAEPHLPVHKSANEILGITAWARLTTAVCVRAYACMYVCTYDLCIVAISHRSNSHSCSEVMMLSDTVGGC